MNTRKYALIAFFALLVFLGYRPMKELVLSIRGVTYDAGVLSCDYEGKSYAEGQQRPSQDGCNVCTCGSTGWNCTKIACVVGDGGTGTITGTLTPPDGGSLRAQRVCAISVKDVNQEFCQQTTENSSGYAIAAKPGVYWVYATRLEGETGKRAYWSEYVKCGALESCKDHSPILVQVASGEISKADPQDWVANVQIDVLNVTPSKWAYSTHNYYPNSVFLVKSRGLSAVKVMATAYPPNPDALAYEVGQAEMSIDDLGVQTWTLAIPKGFEAGAVYAVGTNASGEYTRSHELGIVRPIDTTQ